MKEQIEKAVVITTTNWLGGKNFFLGWSYIVVGILCLLFAIVFIVKQLTCPRKLGDVKYLKLDLSVCSYKHIEIEMTLSFQQRAH